MFVSTKQFVLAFGIDFLSSVPVPADARKIRGVQKLLKSLELRLAALSDLALDKFGDEFREAFVFCSRRHTGAPSNLIGQGDGYVFHDAMSVPPDTNRVFACISVI